MNEHSSRSHAIISIHLEQRVKPNKMKEVRTAAAQQGNGMPA